MDHTSRATAATPRRGVQAPPATAPGREMGLATAAMPGRGLGDASADAAPGRVKVHLGP
jgi:hypothetical protein